MKVINALALCLVILFVATDSSHAASVTLKSPKAGEAWKLGETKNIEWNYSGPDPGAQKWKLVLKKGAADVGTIANKVSGSRYSWSVGKYTGGNATPGADYTIQVLNVASSQIKSSSGAFSISIPRITQKMEGPKQPQPIGPAPKATPPLQKQSPLKIIFPNGGEKLEAGLQYTILWGGSSVGKGGSVNVGLFRGSTQVAPLCKNTPNTGKCIGTVDLHMRPEYLKAKVFSAGPTLFSGESDGNVMITNYRHIKILSPNGGETWKLGDPWVIRWDTGGGWEPPTKTGGIILFVEQASKPGVRIPITVSRETESLHANTGTFTFVPPDVDRFIDYFSYIYQVPNGDFRVCIKVFRGPHDTNMIRIDCSDNTFAITN